ncbi:MAG: type II toxin-antitoxin system HicA family toxin [Nitrococcus mobilis]|nr:type II toxin-antitoxin system HicA family toxin [Nitrococcus mobilis]
MTKTHRKTLEAIFSKTVPDNLEWSRIESLMLAVGCKRSEGRGSRVRFVYGDTAVTFHRPHPQKETRKYQIRIVKEFLEQIGVKP